MTTSEESRTAGSGMELNEAIRRIFVQHWPLITIAVALGVGVGALRTLGGPSFTATTRLVLDAPDPRSSAESTAIADTARAIATSQSQIRRALETGAVAQRDPIDVAKNRVSVSSLGTSGVVQLSVRDRDGTVAAALANALALEIVRTRSGASAGRAELILADLEREINSLSARISRADAASQPQLLQQRSALRADQSSIRATEAARPTASIISQARVPDRPDTTPIAPFLILGGILGLVIGVGAAGFLEIVRPSVVGGVALAHEFGTRYIGTTGSDDLPRHVGALVATAGFPTIGLISAGRAIATAEVQAIAHRFERASGAAPRSEMTVVQDQAVGMPRVPSRGRGGSLEGEGGLAVAVPTRKSARTRRVSPPRPRFSPFFELVPGEFGGEIGLVLVAPKALSKSDLIETSDLLALIPHPVLGLITHEPQRGRRPAVPSDPVMPPGQPVIPSGNST